MRCSAAGVSARRAGSATRRAARARRSRRSRRPAGAAPVGRRAATAGAGPRARPRSRRALPRRADGEPRSRRDQAFEDLIGAIAARQHQGRDGHARPRRGKTPGGRRRVPAPRPRGRGRRRAAISSTHRARRRRGASWRASCCYDHTENHMLPPFRRPAGARCSRSRRLSAQDKSIVVPRRPRPRIPDCSVTCFRCSRPRPAST